ncbi:MAG: RHS repeat-associated core domain-containing protein [Acidobacteriota bacterium]
MKGNAQTVARGLRHEFTAKERDSESSLDYFIARYHSGAQGRFQSPDPYNPVVDIDEADEFSDYLSQPQNWNRYVYVWNNPLRFIDPNGERVYVVTYTTGNSEADEELRRAAQTRALEIRNSKGFDAKKDTVLVRAVFSKSDFANVIKEGNALEKIFGKVEQVSLFAHSGKDGPVFHNSALVSTANPRGAEQFTNRDLAGLRVNWSGSASCSVYGCNTSPNFAQKFANAQGVTTYGIDRYAYFSSSPGGMGPLTARGPVYLIGADYGAASGIGGVVRYNLGFGRVYPMVRHDPAPKDKPRR